MKNVLLVLVATVALSCVYDAPAAAQDEVAVVKIPFSFIVGQRMLPAGSYRIAPTVADWSVVSITNVDTKKAKATFVQTLSDSIGEPYHGQARVKFFPYGGQAFLQQIAVPGRYPRRIVVTQANAARTLARLNLLNGDFSAPAK